MTNSHLFRVIHCGVFVYPAKVSHGWLRKIDARCIKVRRAAKSASAWRAVMNLDQLGILVERLRKEAIGEPENVIEKQAYEYHDQSAKVVAVLKLVRAAHGVNALNLLCRCGLFLDFGAIFRCVNDCTEEVYFLLEKFPTTSGNVDQFVRSFFESTMDGYLSKETPAVLRKKIRSAEVRVLKGNHDDGMLQMLENIYKTFSGYVHADYAHIMEVYEGKSRDFNLAGVPSVQQRQMRMDHVEVAAESVLHAAAFIAQTLGLNDLVHDIVQALKNVGTLDTAS